MKIRRLAFLNKINAVFTVHCSVLRAKIHNIILSKSRSAKTLESVNQSGNGENLTLCPNSFKF